MQHIAQARGDLGALGHQPPATLRPPGEVEGDDEQVTTPGRADPLQGSGVAGMAEDQGRRQQAFRQQSPRAVEIGQHRLQQGGPLGQARLDTRPVRRLDDEGQEFQGPGPAGDALDAKDVMGDAIALDLFGQ